MARPSKLNDKFLHVAGQVINEGDNAIIHTDEDLVFLINERLEEKERITDRTFQRWKAQNWEECTDEESKTGMEFCRVYKKALNIQRQSLFERFKADKNAWQKWAWIIERKFKEWRMPNKHHHGGDPDNDIPIQWKVVNYAGSSENGE